MAINKSASQIGTLVFKNGNRNTLYIGSNSNTGETIVWQQMPGKRSSRVTGGNIKLLVSELNTAVREGAAAWDGDVNLAALDALYLA